MTEETVELHPFPNEIIAIIGEAINDKWKLEVKRLQKIIEELKSTIQQQKQLLIRNKCFFDPDDWSMSHHHPTNCKSHLPYEDYEFES